MIKLCALADEYGSTLEKQIEGLQKNKINLLELRSINKVNVAKISIEDAKKYKKQLDDNHIKVWALASPLGKVDITVDFEQYLKTVHHICQLANLFETNKIRIFSFFNADEQPEKVFAYLQKMVEVAKQYNVELYHENEKDIYGDAIERVKQIMDHVPGLKYIYDPANYIQCQQDTKVALETLFKTTDYFHIKDVIAKTGQLVPAGKGNGRIYELVSLIGNKDKTLTIEPHLAVFDGYASIDQREMKHKYEYASNEEAFNDAVKHLKDVLYSAGYLETKDGYIKDERIVKYGIIGLGNIGTMHLDGFFKFNNVPNGLVTAIADVKQTRIDAILTRFPNAKFDVYHSGAELIEKADVDVVVVAVPHYQHPKLSIQALEKGRHVICEKPAGVYTKQVKEMIEVAKKSKGLFTMMFNQRTNSIYRKMKEIIDNQELGQIKRINWIITDWYRAQSYYDSGDWRATWSGEGGGVLMNQCPHQLDLLQWVTSMMPHKIHAFAHFGKWHDIEVEDDVTAYLEYPNGATGVFITSTADSPGTNRFEILGTKGKLVSEGNDLTFYKNEVDEREFCFTYKGGFGAPKYETINVQTDGENLQHIGIFRNFTNAILEKEPLFVDGIEGINGVILMNGMLLSAWLNKAIDIPFDDDLYVEELQKRIKKSRRKANVSEVIFDTADSFNK